MAKAVIMSDFFLRRAPNPRHDTPFRVILADGFQKRGGAKEMLTSYVPLEEAGASFDFV